MRTGELPMVRAEHDRGRVGKAKCVHLRQDPPDLLVDEGHVSPVDRDELAAVGLAHGVERPVRRVVRLHRRFAQEGLCTEAGSSICSGSYMSKYSSGTTYGRCGP